MPRHPRLAHRSRTTRLGATRRLGLRRRPLLVPRDVLVEDLVGPHHAELLAGALLDRLGAGLEVLHLDGERGVAPLELRVLRFLRRKLAVDLGSAQPAALAEP